MQTDAAILVELIKKSSTFAQKREFDNAIESLKSLLEIDPIHELGLGMLASIYAEIGMRDRAIFYYQKILDINSKNPLARFQMGLAQFNSGENKNALASWAPLVKDKQDFMGHYYSALALLKLDNPSAAREMLIIAQSNMPSDHEFVSTTQKLIDSIQ